MYDIVKNVDEHYVVFFRYKGIDLRLLVKFKRFLP